VIHHVIEAEALRDYLRCPQEYAYRWLYGIPDKPRTRYQLWLRCLRRACLTLVRQVMEKPVSIDQAYLIWQLHAEHTIASIAKWDLKGRELLLQFYEWLQHITPGAIGPTRRLTVPFSSLPRQADLELTADFVARWRGQLAYFLLTPPDPGILKSLGALDTACWVTYNLETGRSKRLTNQTLEQMPDLVGQVEQGFRGLTRSLVWPHRDSRCTPCPFAACCDGRDARSSALKTAKARQRVKDRILKDYTGLSAPNEKW
jgi:hypothetical protein